MKKSKFILIGIAGLTFLGLMAFAGTHSIRFLGTKPCTETPPQPEGVKVMKLCDGETKVIIGVQGLKNGEVMTPDVAREVAALMWEKYQELKKDNDKEIVVAHGKEVHTQRDKMVWETELKRVVDEGYKLFHSPELGTNGISCDMCHPDASNTHPETYPKFQTQLKKVALLRDMINWCIENPLEGKKLSDDDPKMKALEAYIIFTRKGKTLEPGKH